MSGYLNNLQWSIHAYDYDQLIHVGNLLNLYKSLINVNDNYGN